MSSIQALTASPEAVVLLPAAAAGPARVGRGEWRTMRILSFRSFSAVLLASSLLFGCSSDDEDDGPGEEVCLVARDIPALGAVTGTTSANGAGDPTISFNVDAGPPRDALQLKLVANTGAFAGGAIKTGTFQISGADAGFTTCGLCVAIVADIVAMQGPSKLYQATSGEVTITSATRPYAGTLRNISFGEVTFDGAPVPGCKADLAEVSFTSN
jgi:hypothetical protein